MSDDKRDTSNELIGQAYADGYRAGHTIGYDAGYAACLQEVRQALLRIADNAGTRTLVSPQVFPAPPSTFIDDLEPHLELRVLNLLKRNGVYTIADLIKLTERDLLDIPLLGPLALGQIKEALSGSGHRLSSSMTAST